MKGSVQTWHIINSQGEGSAPLNHRMNLSASYLFMAKQAG